MIINIFQLQLCDHDSLLELIVCAIEIIVSGFCLHNSIHIVSITIQQSQHTETTTPIILEVHYSNLNFLLFVFDSISFCFISIGAVCVMGDNSLRIQTETKKRMINDEEIEDPQELASQISIAAFITDYFTMTYTLIICNSLSMIPITNDTLGKILIMEYFPDWGLFITLVCLLAVTCFATCIYLLCKKKNICLYFLFFIFSFPMMGLTIYLINFSQKYPSLIEKYEKNNPLITDNYINTTEYLSKLAMLVFFMTWSQLGIDFIGCCRYTLLQIAD